MCRRIFEVQCDRPLALIVLVEVTRTIEAARLALRPWRQHARDTGGPMHPVHDLWQSLATACLAIAGAVANHYAGRRYHRGDRQRAQRRHHSVEDGPRPGPARSLIKRTARHPRVQDAAYTVRCSQPWLPGGGLVQGGKKPGRSRDWEVTDMHRRRRAEHPGTPLMPRAS